ncbi:MAG: FtsX-like permease family protein, partial [Calditrichaeota bacterium]|nr:FtsX-like permease family protein [Calditrichota bacterium]
FSFLNDRFDQMYRAEKRLGDVFNVFAMIAIFIACLGLFGLAAFTAEQRTKEIGVRKVLGASVPGVVGLLTKDFIKLVCIAFLVASPIAWYIMNMWLADFAFRTEISWWVFALAGAIATVIAMLTISYQAIRTALSNPVKTLRYE